MYSATEVDFASQGEIARLERTVLRVVSGRLRNFRLLVHAGGLVLQGDAGTFYAKQLAQHIIMGASDLPIWANEIAVHDESTDPAA
jgi:hypothetical protein